MSLGYMVPTEFEAQLRAQTEIDDAKPIIDKLNQAKEQKVCHRPCVDTLYDCALENGIRVVQEIGEQFWGHRDFTIEDPFGNLVTFSERIV